jgi:predicted acetyltransferase
VSGWDSWGPPSGEAELTALGQLITQAFVLPAQGWEAWIDLVGAANYRVARRAGELVGAAGVIPVGQWWGGRRLEMAAVTTVGIPPELRRGGLASALMRTLLGELRGQGTPLSTLYATTHQLYRRVGYAVAGGRCDYSLDLRGVNLTAHQPPVRRLPLEASAALQELHRARAERRPGWVDRDACLWGRVLQRFDGPVHAYAIGGDEGAPLRGYVVFDQLRRPHPEGGELRVRDLVAADDEAAARLWTFLADHATITRRVQWSGAPADPLLDALPELGAVSVREVEPWLLRLVHVPRALMLRGYPPALDLELHLDVQDEVLPENAGRLVLRVSNGQAQVDGGAGRGELCLGASALAQLYSGYRSAHELQAQARLTGPVAALDVADALFAGPPPAMCDRF